LEIIFLVAADELEREDEGVFDPHPAGARSGDFTLKDFK